MKINGTLKFHVKLGCEIPDRALALVGGTPEAILAKATSMVGPLLSEALKNGFVRLAIIGIQVKVLETTVSITEDKG